MKGLMARLTGSKAKEAKLAAEEAAKQAKLAEGFIEAVKTNYESHTIQWKGVADEETKAFHTKAEMETITHIYRDQGLKDLPTKELNGEAVYNAYIDNLYTSIHAMQAITYLEKTNPASMELASMKIEQMKRAQELPLSIRAAFSPTVVHKEVVEGAAKSAEVRPSVRSQATSMQTQHTESFVEKVSHEHGHKHLSKEDTKQAYLKNEKAQHPAVAIAIKQLVQEMPGVKKFNPMDFENQKAFIEATKAIEKQGIDLKGATADPKKFEAAMAFLTDKKNRKTIKTAVKEKIPSTGQAR